MKTIRECLVSMLRHFDDIGYNYTRTETAIIFYEERNEWDFQIIAKAYDNLLLPEPFLDLKRI